jgi:DNA primase
MSTKEEKVRIDGREVKITRPEKILFPDDGLRKRDLVDYCRRIIPWILPISVAGHSPWNATRMGSTGLVFSISLRPHIIPVGSRQS